MLTERPQLDPDAQLQNGIASFFNQYELQHKIEQKDGEPFIIGPYLIEKAYRVFATGSRDDAKARKMIDDFVATRYPDYRPDEQVISKN